MRRASRIGSTVVSHPWAVIAVAGLVLFGMWVASTRTQAHHVRAVFGDAVSILPGLDVQVNGTDVGKVSKIEYVDGQAIVRLGIDDDSVWPLRQGTTATIRFGTTVGNGTRKIDLVPGPASAPEIPEDGLIARDNAKIPTEFDQVFQTFDTRTREDLKTWQKTMNGSLRGRAQRLGEGVRAAAPAFDAAGGVLGDLAVDQGTLRSLVRNGDAATRTLAARDDQIRGLMTVAGGIL